MSGQAFIKGEPGDSRRRGKTPVTDWPPKYAKACLQLIDPRSGGHVGDWAFCDSRRFGRIQLIHADNPEMVAPLSLLGTDPLLEMMPLETMSAKLAKRHAPIKAVLLDQNGPLCGIGNWMVDEILYHAQIHPAHPAAALTADELIRVHDNISYVTNTAVQCNADAASFPSHWLFKKRWGKGRRDDHSFTLPDGRITKIVFETVGGRTSAIVEAVQKLPSSVSKTTRTIKKSKQAKRRRRLGSSSSEEADGVLNGEADKFKLKDDPSVAREAVHDHVSEDQALVENQTPVDEGKEPVKRRRRSLRAVVVSVHAPTEP
ncbi:hypothetical protein OIV83_001483 [Microbotryomycetes sp. JL201]|nr:hypothetical protein OIV83_001483 [Microbotryomycetes sp. JL201]